MMTALKRLAPWLLFAAVAIGWILFAAIRPTPSSVVLKYHGGTVHAYQDLLLGLRVAAEDRQEQLDAIAAAKEDSINDYLDDPDALCDALDRLTR